MTDQEINKAIAKIEYPDTKIQTFDMRKDAVHVAEVGIGFVDYVNDWADIGPIIEREKIDINYDDKFFWSAYGCTDNVALDAMAVTPTKAAALCYLKMKGIEV